MFREKIAKEAADLALRLEKRGCGFWLDFNVRCAMALLRTLASAIVRLRRNGRDSSAEQLILDALVDVIANEEPEIRRIVSALLIDPDLQ